MTKWILVSVAVLFMTVGTTAQGARRDGNWWRDSSPVEKSSFVIGFFDGMHLGHNFSYWGSVTRGQLQDFKSLDSFDDYASKFMDNVRSDQIVDGLDSLYEDYQNRRIMVRDAVWLALNGIAGKPKAELDRMIENSRRNAGR